MAVEFLQQFTDHAFSVGQCVSEQSSIVTRWLRHDSLSLFMQLPFQFMDKKTLTLAVKDIEGTHWPLTEVSFEW